MLDYAFLGKKLKLMLECNTNVGIWYQTIKRHKENLNMRFFLEIWSKITSMKETPVMDTPS
jgi:hypothetical protein